MTDRVQRLHVTLDKEYRTDDVQSIVNAIEMVRGVSSVELSEPMDPTDYMARATVFGEFNIMMYQLLAEARQNSDAYKQIKAVLASKSELRGFG